MSAATMTKSDPGGLTGRAGFMKAIVFHGPGRRAWEDRPRPMLQPPTDVIVRVTATT